MIGTINIHCNAARPQMPLEPLTAFKSSPSSIRVLDVPKKIGDWTITQVYVSAKYPDNTISTKECVRVGNVWVGTIDACDTPGDTENGFVVGANGIDENGEDVHGYILGVGDVMILDGDTQFHPGVKSFYLKIFEDMPDDPKIGDSYFDGINQDILKTFNGYDWIDLGVDPGQYIHFGSNPVVDEYGVQRSVVLKYLANELSLDSQSISVKTNGAGCSISPTMLSIQNQIIFTYHPGTASVDATIGDFKIQKNSSNGYDATLGKITLRTANRLNEITIGSNSGKKTQYNQDGLLISNEATPWLYTTYGYGSAILNDDLNYGGLTIGSASGQVSIGPGIMLTSSNTENKITIGGKNVLVEGDVDVKNNKITIKQGGVEKGSFTLNQGTDKTIELDAGGGGSSKCLMRIGSISNSSQSVKWSSGTDRYEAGFNSGLTLFKNDVEQRGSQPINGYLTEVEGTIQIDDNGYSSETTILVDGVRQSSYSTINTTGKKFINIYLLDCLEQTTPITMADGTTKMVCELSRGDKVLSLNPDTLQLEEDEVSDCDAGMMKMSNKMDVWNFADGTSIKTIKPHQFFNTRTNKMEYIADFQIGDGVRKQDGSTTTLTGHETKIGVFFHNTLYTKKYNNYFANGILTGNRHSKKWGWYWIQRNQEV